MHLHVGPFNYCVIVADRRIYDEQGDELEGRALENPRMIILSPIVDPERRPEVLRHELEHCWHFSVPHPASEEEAANLAAMIDQQWNADLEAQGGRQALQTLAPSKVPQLGRPAVSRPPAAAQEPMGRPDRAVCGGCGTEVMCGSIVTGEPVLHEATRQVHVSRFFECECCGIVQTWLELATSDGRPLGTYIANPPPRMLRVAAAAGFLKEQAELASVLLH